MTAAASGPERDLQAEQDHAEWLGWAEANGYGNEFERDFGHDDMRDAFTAGMEAARMLAAQEPSAPEPAAAMTENRRYREALETIARENADYPNSRVRSTARTAQHALEGK